METAGTPLHVVEAATRLKGEVTCAPLTGTLTVIASADTLDVASTRKAERKVFISSLEP